MTIDLRQTQIYAPRKETGDTYFDPRWFVIYSKPRMESLAELNLRRQSYETYLPLVRLFQRRRGAWRQAVEPLFPRYLFIRMTAKQNTISPIASTRGVSNLVRFGQQMATAPDTLVDQLRSAEDPAQGVHDLVKPIFIQGEKVRVLEGALAGFEAIFEAQNGDTRVTILMDILGRATSRIMLERDSIGRV